MSEGELAGADLNSDPVAQDEVFEGRGIAAKPSRWQRWDELPIGGRELIATLASVVLCDIVIYRGEGFAGYAVLFAAFPLLFLLGTCKPHYGAATLFSIGSLFLIGLRLAWLGNWLAVSVGFCFLLAAAMALRGLRPHVPESCKYAIVLLGVGFRRVACYFDARLPASVVHPRSPSLEVLLPVGAVLLFGWIFVMANPNLFDRVAEVFSTIGDFISNWCSQFGVSEVLFWVLVAVATLGLLRPKLNLLKLEDDEEGIDLEEAETPLYKPFRNTLLTVVVLFAIYLVYEFATLWFREFPEGFYYAGYAHEGAAWLTVALGVATLIISLIFRPHTLADPRHVKLKRLTWIWSCLNLLLALAVYNRMHIYIDFNGMTRMRMIGLFGITTVIAGFALVLLKISRRRSFGWLVRRQLWALALAIAIYSLTPVDMIVHKYNVSRIMNGDLAPAVQISVQPVNSEGYLTLAPLLDCDDAIIRRGIQAKLAAALIQRRAEDVEDVSASPTEDRGDGKPDDSDAGDSQQADAISISGWTDFQLAERLLLRQLESLKTKLKPMLSDARARSVAIGQFDDYAYQWY